VFCPNGEDLTTQNLHSPDQKDWPALNLLHDASHFNLLAGGDGKGAITD
jgi:hypothetical protein